MIKISSCICIEKRESRPTSYSGGEAANNVLAPQVATSQDNEKLQAGWRDLHATWAAQLEE